MTGQYSNFLRSILSLAALVSVSCSTTEQTAADPASASSPVPQPTSTQESARRDTHYSLVKEKGWIAIDKSKLETKRVRSQVDGQDAFVTIFVPKTPQRLSLNCREVNAAERCDPFPLGGDYYISEMIAYDFRNRVFAITAVLSGIDQRTSPALHLFTFLDTDGDGVFETLSNGDEPLDIPNWTRK